MKADDPRLVKSRTEAIERVTRVNEMIVTVLKNHLVVEQFMDEFLAASGKKAKGSFADRAQHCQSLNPPEIEPPIWKVLTAANQLRNKIAHAGPSGNKNEDGRSARRLPCSFIGPTTAALGESG